MTLSKAFLFIVRLIAYCLLLEEDTRCYTASWTMQNTNRQVS